jgi:hypothetical protein
MLECLFSGPSLSITIGENRGWEHIDHMKKDCPGGIYKRLDLPRTLSFFVMQIPPGQRRTGDQWELAGSCPSYAGFGTPPELRITYRISHMDKNQLTVQIACDTTLKNISVVMPNGEKASIISNRVRVEGTIAVGADGGLCREGKAFISEKMRYVRGEIDTAVLHKECRYSLTLASIP